MKKLILFGFPLCLFLLLVVPILDWLGGYEYQSFLLSISPFLYFYVAVFLGTWFFQVKKANLKKGYYSKHVITSLIVRSFVVVVSVILFSDLLIVMLEEAFEWSGKKLLTVGIVGSIASIILFVAISEISADATLKIESQLDE